MIRIRFEKKVYSKTELCYTLFGNIVNTRKDHWHQEHGGSSWSSVQVEVEKAQKIRGLLNAFGVYDHANHKSQYITIERRRQNSLLTF